MRALSTVVKEEHLEAIIPKLCDDFSDIRKEAATALGLIGSEKAIGALSQSLNDSDIEVRIASQKALNKVMNICFSHLQELSEEIEECINNKDELTADILKQEQQQLSKAINIVREHISDSIDDGK